MAEGQLVDKIYYQLGWEVSKASTDAKAFEQSGEVIARAATKAEDAITELLEELAKTPEGMRRLKEMADQVLHATDRVSEGMTRGGSGTERFAQGMRKLAQQQAESRVQAERLATSNDRLLAGLTQSGQAAAAATAGNRAWEAGIQRLREQQNALTQSSTDASKGANKIQNALVSLAVQGTQTGGAVGKVVEGALLFGAGSLAVTGMAAGITVITVLLKAFTKEAREAAEGAQALVEEGKKRLLESAAAQAAEDVKQAQEVVDRLDQVRKDRLAKAKEANQSGRETVGPLQTTEEKAEEDRLFLQAQGELEARQKALERAHAAQREANNQVLNDLAIERERLERAVANSRSVGLPTEELERQLEDLKKLQQAVAALPPAEQGGVRAAIQAQQEAARQREADRIAGIRERLNRELTSVLPTTVDNAVDAITRLGRELTEAGVPVKQVEQDLAPLIARLRELRDAALGEQLKVIEAGPDTAESLAALDRLSADLIVTQSQLVDGSAEELAVRSRIQRVAEAIARINARIAGLQHDNNDAVADGAEAADNLRLTTAQIASQVEGITRAGIGLAQGFGLANDSAAALLQNVLTTANALPDVLDQVNKIGKSKDGKSLFDPTAFTTGIIGVLGGLAGVASSFFGKDPVEERANELRDRNNEVIQKLTDEIGNLNLDISGKSFAAAVDGIKDLLSVNSKRLGKPGGGSIPDDLVDRGRELNKRAIDGILRGSGSSLRELKDLAASLGIELNTDNVKAFRDSLKQLQKALRETEITQFAQTFAGQLQALQDQLDLLDITDPLEQLKAFQEFTQQTNPKTGELLGSPAIAEALKGLNLDDPSQRAEAERRLQELFKKLQTGELTPEQLGLTLDEFRRLLLQIEGLIDESNKADGTDSGAPQQQSFGEFRGISDVRGSALEGLLTSVDLHLVEIRDLLASALVTGGFVAPPALPVATAAGVGGIAVTVTIQQLVISSPGGLSDGALRAAATQVGLGLGDGIARQLGQQVAARARWNGTQVT